MAGETIFIIGFLIFIVAMLAIDLGLFSKPDKPVTTKHALIMSAVWIALALGFYGLILAFGDQLHGIKTFADLQAANAHNFHNLTLNPADFPGSLDLYRRNLSLEFITGYVVEYALSVDNIFVIVLIFTAFKVDQKHYHKVLFWGIAGAVIMRFIFVFIGAAAIARAEWVLYLFGAFLVFTGIRMFVNRNKHEDIDTEKHPIVKLASRFFAVHPKFEGDLFFVNINAKKMITPLFLVLLIIEFTDLVFAVDSIPAVFSVTKDPYIVFFSNIFAILGLRSMFFLLVNIIDKFHYLKIGLAALLAFIGAKMLAGHYAEAIGLTTTRSLIVILLILAISIAASLIFPQKQTLATKK
ncbi:TerC/Alx family metal homeostasis membrane protein [Mucilaginibacter sp. AW1-3]